MAPMERARWELSIGAIFVYETLFLSSLWLDFGYARNSDLKSESNHDLIWFARDFAPHDLIWFDDSEKFDDLIWFEIKSLLRRFDLIWFEFAHPWSRTATFGCLSPFKGVLLVI